MGGKMSRRKHQNPNRNTFNLFSGALLLILILGLTPAACSGGEEVSVIMDVEHGSKARSAQDVSEQVQARMGEICLGEGEKIGEIGLVLCDAISSAPPTYRCRTKVKCKKGANPDFVPPPLKKADVQINKPYK
jgi:hypothetical protein